MSELHITDQELVARTLQDRDAYRHVVERYTDPLRRYVRRLGAGPVLDSYDVGHGVHKYLLSHTDFYDGLIFSSEDSTD